MGQTGFLTIQRDLSIPTIGLTDGMYKISSGRLLPYVDQSNPLRDKKFKVLKMWSTVSLYHNSIVTIEPTFQFTITKNFKPNTTAQNLMSNTATIPNYDTVSILYGEHNMSVDQNPRVYEHVSEPPQGYHLFKMRPSDELYYNILIVCNDYTVSQLLDSGGALTLTLFYEMED